MNLPILNGIFQPLNQTLVDLFEIRTCSKFILVILNGKLVKSNQKMPFFAKAFLLQTSQPNLGKPIFLLRTSEPNFSKLI